MSPTRTSAACEQVACPWCGVRAGRRCIEPSGADRRPGEYHRARVLAWGRRNEQGKGAEK